MATRMLKSVHSIIKIPKHMNRRIKYSTVKSHKRRDTIKPKIVNRIVNINHIGQQMTAVTLFVEFYISISIIVKIKGYNIAGKIPSELSPSFKINTGQRTSNFCL